MLFQAVPIPWEPLNTVRFSFTHFLPGLHSALSCYDHTTLSLGRSLKGVWVGGGGVGVWVAGFHWASPSFCIWKFCLDCHINSVNRTPAPHLEFFGVWLVCVCSERRVRCSGLRFRWLFQSGLTLWNFCMNVCARCPAVNRCLIQVEFLHHSQRSWESWDRLWIQPYPGQWLVIIKLLIKLIINHLYWVIFTIANNDDDIIKNNNNMKEDSLIEL